ncbi:Bifunctional protein HldE [Gemmata sp. SH-PL17]|uniref:bifunctional heptose 7-phosphate kinase/heptose 1-phosphate adenyltransferase n=1 Tax=Gemmata sp. SH-PL17 TaxID=1630693 RepID=UPI00078DEA89|nr:PfkB family carbohydrate kinase [Gemmata sp. SH-PL17]AMV25175.1 Bifunctional protein HldE [Gemmata sp. SH-PL17]
MPHTDAPAPDWGALVAELAGRCLLVLGDVMLDEYVAGEARRVCPEAPVPVVEATARWAVPGGAANAAANAAALGARAVLGGATGADPGAGALARAARDRGVDPAGLVPDPGRPTTSKLRVLARGQQITRVDTESTGPVTGEPAERLGAWAERALAGAGAVLLSDYGKGLFAGPLAPRVLGAAARAGRPVVVDPKGTDPDRYRGAAVVKPNLAELGDLTGLPVRTGEQFRRAGLRLAGRLPGTAVLVTRGGDGMVLFRAGADPRALPGGPVHAVCDVTGAGDTAAAALALGLAAGWAVELAARVANAAAGVAVCKVGTAVVAPAELRAALGPGVPDFGPLTD